MVMKELKTTSDFANGYSKIWQLWTSKTFDRALCIHVLALFDHTKSAHIDG